MSILNIFKRNTQSPVEEPVYQEPLPVLAPMTKNDFTKMYRDVQLRVSSAERPSLDEAIKELPRPALPIETYQKSQTNTRDRNRGLSFEPSHYNLREFAQAKDSESLINTSIERHVEIALQHGFSFQGEDQEVIDYLNKRVFEIEIMSGGLSMRKVISQLLDQLVTYGTAFLAVNRSKGKSTGNKIKYFGKTLDPISSWAVPDAITMSVAENTRGHPIRWKQRVQEYGILSGAKSEEREFADDQIFVFQRHIQPGRIFGRSLFLPVLDDVLTLRSLEDLVYVLSQKYTFPLHQHVIGTDERPASNMVLSDGTEISEVEYAKNVIEHMPTEGGFVTSERHEIRLLGTEGKVLDLSKYLEHFRQRVQDATRMSNAVLGTGNEQSKASAQTQFQSLRDSAKYLQDQIIDGFKNVIFHLLMEGGFSVDHENFPLLSFSPPDVEERRANENHIKDQFQSDLITRAEARRGLGKEDMTEEEEANTFSAKTHEREKEIVKVTAASRPAPAGSSTKKKATSSKNKTRSQTQPRNQHGKKATKTRSKANDSQFLSLWKELSDSVASDLNDSSGHTVLISTFLDNVMDLVKSVYGNEIQKQTQKARDRSGKSYVIVTLEQRDKIFDSIRESLHSFVSGVLSSSHESSVETISLFQVSEDSFLRAIDKEVSFLSKASLLGALKNAGVDKVKLISKDKKNPVTIDTCDYTDGALRLLDVTFEVNDENSLA